jgi:hypothetical protein
MTTDEILRRLIEAHRVIDAVVSSPRPKSFGSNMPEILRFPTEYDVWMAEMDSIKSDGGATFRSMQSHRVRQLEQLARSHYTSKQISDAEDAMRWPAMVQDPTRRELLNLKVKCEAKGGQWTKWLTARNRKLPARNGILRQNSYRLITLALQDIREGLVKRSELLTSSRR